MDITYFLRSICKKKKLSCLYPSVADPGEGPRKPPLFLETTPPPHLPYLRVWIRQDNALIGVLYSSMYIDFLSK